MTNKGLMLRWGFTIAVLLVLGSIPLFIGLAVVLPWLGYATWHLYTHLIDRSALDICKDVNEKGRRWRRPPLHPW